MTSLAKDSWNTLEVSKLIASFLTPVLLFWLAFSVEESIRDAELTRERLKSEQAFLQQRQSAVQGFSQFIYERRSRSALLSSAIRRHGNEPAHHSMLELLHRKRLYDEAYHNWNTNHQANLLKVRQILDSSSYTYFEKIVETRLVLNTFRPLDRCLTKAYDEAIRNRDGRIVLDGCEVTELIQRALDCGYSITDGLFKLSNNDVEQSSVESSVNMRCPITL